MFFVWKFPSLIFLKRHSLSNHFLFDIGLILLRFFPVLIFKHFFAAMINMLSTFSSVELTSWIGVSLSMYSRMRVWRSAERMMSLNFGAESFSQRNCIGRRDSRLLSCEGSSSEKIFSQVIIELWSDKEHGCLTTKLQHLEEYLGHILHNRRHLSYFFRERWLYLKYHSWLV